MASVGGSLKCSKDCTCGRHKSSWNKGLPSMFKGKKLSFEQVAKQNASRRAGAGWAKSPEQRTKLRIAQLGKTHSIETIEKMKASRQGRTWSDATREKLRRSALKRIQREQVAQPTSIERAIKAELEQLGIRYSHQEILFETYTVDFLIPDKNLIIECDGEYWHNLPGAKAKDKNRDAWLGRRGFTTVRLLESEIRRNPRQALLAALGNN